MKFEELHRIKFLKFLEDNKPKRIIYISPKDFPDYIENFSEELQTIAFKIGKNDTGAVVLDEKILVIPPLPVEKTFKGDLSYLNDLISRKYTLGVILLRLGEYSIGIFDSGELKIHKTGTQFVSGKIKAGGQSAARFQRVREGQINDFFKGVCSQIKEKFRPFENKIDFIFFGGDSIVAKDFSKFCDYLNRFKIMRRTLNARHMKHETLRNILKEVWKFKVYEV